jgi:hypothetical protein
MFFVDIDVFIFTRTDLLKNNIEPDRIVHSVKMYETRRLSI